MLAAPSMHSTPDILPHLSIDVRCMLAAQLACCAKGWHRRAAVRLVDPASGDAGHSCDQIQAAKEDVR